jgi:SNF2 family DNA or RNA helicase
VKKTVRLLTLLVAIQNSYSELWTLLDWTNPGALGTRKQWEGYVAQPLVRGQSRSANNEEKYQGAVRDFCCLQDPAGWED